jgi:hypothetical protein
MTLFKRQVSSKIIDYSQYFPVVSVTGPRQSGKTTLIKSLFPDFDYYNLETPSVLARIQADPLEILKHGMTRGIVLDEVQRFPALLSYIQGVVDEQKVMGKVVISGSQNLLLSAKIGQSLAGRVGSVHLYPLSIDELRINHILQNEVAGNIFQGFYPAIFDRLIPAEIYYSQYIETYLERDVKQLRDVGNIFLFHKFLGLVAGRVGQVLNQASIAVDVGVSAPTIESWLSILEASFVIFRLQPYFTNIGKRLIKSPKVYFYDTGLLCFLLGIKEEKTLSQHYLFGNIFENLVMADLFKELNNTSSHFELYYVRDSNGNEVDALLVKSLDQIAIEIKASSTFRSDFVKGLKYWRENSKELRHEVVIFSGKTAIKAGGTLLVNWQDFKKLLEHVTK